MAGIDEMDGASLADLDAVRAAGRPVILRDLVSAWPAVAAGRESDEAMATYLKTVASAVPASTMIADGSTGGRYFYDAEMRGFNFAKRNVPIAATIDKLLSQREEANPLSIYAGATSSAEVFPGFAAANPMPLVPERTMPLVWVGNAARIAPHFDESENIACCVRGERTFVIFPPGQVGNLSPGPLDVTMAGQPASLVDPRDPDLDRFPRYEEAQKAARVAILRPGDALYLPSLWWHYVESRGALNVLVNYWWREREAGSGIDALALALLSLRDTPLPERRAWAALFEHYVFGEDAPHAADHLPEHAKSVLGPPSPARDARIKAFLRQALPPTLS